MAKLIDEICELVQDHFFSIACNNHTSEYFLAFIEFAYAIRIKHENLQTLYTVPYFSLQTLYFF